MIEQINFSCFQNLIMILWNNSSWILKIIHKPSFNLLVFLQFFILLSSGADENFSKLNLYGTDSSFEIRELMYVIKMTNVLVNEIQQFLISYTITGI